MAAASPDDGSKNRSVSIENTVQQHEGNALQANEVGTVNFHARASQLPHELPRDVPGFAGRDDELARLDELLAEHGDRGSPIVITGPDGVGKTALALHWAHRNSGAFPDGEIYLDLGGVEPEDALATALRSLGDHPNADAPTAERSRHYRSRLHGKRMLVLLDDARDAAQIRSLLPNDNASLVLLTSRDDLADLAGDPARISLAARPGSAMPGGPPVPDLPEAEPAPVAPDGPPYDVFVSHAAEDGDWVREFVAALRARGVRVVHDVLLPGDRRAHAVELAIAESRHGLLVFSRAAMADEWVREEYEVLLGRSARTGRRFIPVVIDDVQLPSFAGGRYTCDFRGGSSRSRDDQFDRLVRALTRGS